MTPLDRTRQRQVERFARVLRRGKLTQAGLAATLGCTQAAVSRYSTGARRAPGSILLLLGRLEADLRGSTPRARGR